MNKTIRIIISTIFILAVGMIGYYIGVKGIVKISGGKTLMQCQEELERYKKAADAMFPQLPPEIFSIGGRIKEVGSDYLVIETQSFTERVLFGDMPKLEDRKILIDNKTKLVKTSIIFPKPGEEVKDAREELIKLIEFNPDDFVLITATENIKDKKEFIAAEIVLQAVPEPEMEIPPIPTIERVK